MTIVRQTKRIITSAVNPRIESIIAMRCDKMRTNASMLDVAARYMSTPLSCVDAPAHYTQGKVECVDALLSAFGTSQRPFCLYDDRPTFF